MKSLPATAWAALAVLLFSLALWLRAPALVDTLLNSDEGFYAVVASQWSRGQQPYRDLFDHKPPLVYLAYRVAFAGFGESLAAPRLLWTLAVALAGLGVAAVVRSLCGGWLAPVVAAGTAVVFLGSPLVEGQTANAETLMVLATTWAAFFSAASSRPGGLSPLRVAAAGVYSGLALLAKPVAVFEVAFLFVWMVRFSPRRGFNLVTFALAAVVPALIWCAYAAAHGDLRDSFDAVVMYNLHYASASPAPVLARVVLLVVDYGPPLALLWAGVAACLLSSLRTERRAPDFALGWTAAALIGALSGGRLYEHYFQQLVTPMAVGLGVTTAALASRLVRRAARAAAVAVLALGLWPPLAARVRLLSNPVGCTPWQDRLAELIRDRTDDDDRLLVWGYEPYIHFASRRMPPERYFCKYPFLGDSAGAQTARARLRAATTAHPPAVVVVLKGELTAEPTAGPEQEILAADAPFHWLIDGAPVLDTPEFLLYTSPERREGAWRQNWLDLFRRECQIERTS